MFLFGVVGEVVDVTARLMAGSMPVQRCQSDLVNEKWVCLWGFFYDFFFFIFVSYLGICSI